MITRRTLLGGLVLVTAASVPDRASKTIAHVFYDDFTGTRLSADNWHREGKTAGGYGIEKFESDPDLIYVDGRGHLVVSAKKDSDGTWRGGMVTTCDSLRITEGVVEFRAKLPRMAGAWPAVWLMANSVDGSSGGNKAEIDIMELFPGGGVLGPGTYSTIHDWTSDPPASYTLQKPSVLAADGNWHVWRLHLTHDAMNFFVDGTPQGGWRRSDLAAWPWSSHPMFLVLNMAVGGRYDGAILPDADTYDLTMYVDYVSVVQS